MDIKDRQRQHYDRLFREYEAKTEQSAYMGLLRSRYTLDRWTGRLAGQRVLDLGCGHGDTALRLAAASCAVMGLDISMQFVRRSRERVGPAARAGWLQGDAEQLPFADGSFDAVVSLGTLHHLPRPEQAIAEVARVLRPGGWLLALEPNAAAYHHTIEFYAALIPARLRDRLLAWRGRRLARSAAEDDDLHVGTRSPAQYQEIFRRAGLHANIRTLIVPFFPFTVLGLHRHVAVWQGVIWLSDLLAWAYRPLRDRGQVQIIEARKGAG
ncbi:MAG: methyltransferase domain-containing protein [Chloroflexi bacterium]|nr:methyltransferase domain-containing protein [Chloroflexota bacterium]MBU1751411.1 methyltransferase domain-containing protein [Chloroflexota bacterium]